MGTRERAGDGGSGSESAATHGNSDQSCVHVSLSK